MASRFWLVVPIIVEGGGLVETAGEPAVVVSYAERAAEARQQYLCLDSLYGPSATCRFSNGQYVGK